MDSSLCSKWGPTTRKNNQKCILFNLFIFKVFGALLGKQAGRNIEIWNSFELKSTIIETEGKQKQHQIEEEYFLQRCILCKYFEYS